MPETLELPESKHLDLSIDAEDQLFPIARALASQDRLKILKAIGCKSLNVNELAEMLGFPISTTALHIRVLEEAGLVRCELQPGVRGTMKLCNRKIDTLAVALTPRNDHNESVLEMNLNVGCYSLAEEIVPTCGLAGSSSSIGEDDNPRSFYHPDHFMAQLIWFRHGYVVYRFGMLPQIKHTEILWLELSFEACSEAPMYRNPWKSDIDVAINDCKIGTWTSPADYGGRRGLLNPSWWSDISTQYGALKTWLVNHEGTYLDNHPISNVTIDDLFLKEHPSIAVQISAPADAPNAGGLNLFGKAFGDFTQGIVLKIGYRVIAEGK